MSTYKATSIPPPPPPRSNTSESSEDIEDQDDDFSDWDSEVGETTKSLFDESTHPSAASAIEYDSKTFKYDLSAESSRMGLEVFGRMQLINYIRKEKLSSEQAKALTESSEIFQDDSLLQPVIPDDPLLQYNFDDSWSDDEFQPAPSSSTAGPSATSAFTNNQNPQAPGLKSLPNTPTVQTKLEIELQKTKADLQALQALFARTMGMEDEVASSSSSPELKNGEGKGKSKVVSGEKEGRDDDTHYFASYAENDIHEIMLKDTVRTVSYARFILSNPQLFKGATVMDVGCGTGVLSMFAAKAGAKHVYAIEASGFASKARENVVRNGFGDVITVIQGKVEDIDLPVKEVDIIVSEWMGYFLLYESMLDSVLVARDRFLSPTGLMIPSQTRLVISAITGERIRKERIEFWSSVYGFDMGVMDPTYFEEGLVEVVDQEEVKTTEYIVRDINTHSATPKSLDFHAPFTLTSNTTTPTKITAFLTHFDTFFSPTSGEGSHVPEDIDVEILPFRDDEYERPVVPLQPQEKGVGVSFTTGPRGKPTHWKQVAFLLKKPFTLGPGDKVTGQLFCKKSPTNSRELDVEIHYSVNVQDGDEQREYVVQVYKVR